MQKELELWNFVSEKLGSGLNVVFLVVAESAGSSPGRPGFKLAVANDELIGSIGGGVMEVRLVNEAKELLKRRGLSLRGSVEAETINFDEETTASRTPIETADAELPTQTAQLIRQVHREDTEDASGMICSGEQTVVRFRLGDSDRKAVEKLQGLLQNGEIGGYSISDRGFRVLKAPKTQASPKLRRFPAGGFEYTEVLAPGNRLFIVGGGHCALALSDVMSKLDFHVSLFDDRPELNTLEKNRFADQKTVIGSYEEIAGHIPSGDDVYVVVMTIGYKFDDLVIRRLIKKDFRYFGVLGSEAKMNLLLRELEKDGFDPERIGRIHTPIGLQIRSRTPEEIAVSIAAEMIAVKNSKR